MDALCNRIVQVALSIASVKEKPFRAAHFTSRGSDPRRPPPGGNLCKAGR